jgi:hypothetical protein
MKHAKLPPFKHLAGLLIPYVKSLLDVKNASLLFLLIFLLWQVGYDTCLQPNLSKLGILDKLVKQSEKQKIAQDNYKHLFEELQKVLADLTVELPVTAQHQSKSLVAVNQSERLLKLAKGEARSPLLPNRSPGAFVQVVKLTSAGAAKDITVAEFITGEKKTSDAATASSLPPAVPPSGGPGPGGKNNEPADPPDPPLPTAETVRKLDDKAIPLTQVDYQLVAHGTYIGFMDLINQIVLTPKLIAIRDLNIKPVEGKPPGFLELTLDVSFLISTEP